MSRITTAISGIDQVFGVYDMRGSDKQARTVILGNGAFSRLLVDVLKSSSQSEYLVIGVVADEGESPDKAFPVLGTVSTLADIVEVHEIERIIVADDSIDHFIFDHRLIEARMCRDIRVEDAETVYENLTGTVPIEALTAMDVIFSDDYHPSWATNIFGRLSSVTIAAFGAVLLSPLYLLIAALIKMDSKGPVLFVQKRIGYKGKAFDLYKFRTMSVTDEQTSEWAVDNGHRITRVGHWLRKFRMDEIPQFINVLRGDMNLVGPRPHPASNLPLFVLVSRNMADCGAQIPFYSLRLRVRPGMTGWAQVRYQYANNLDEEIQKLKYDLYYVKHCSPSLDLKIMFETIGVVLFKGESSTERGSPSISTNQS